MIGRAVAIIVLKQDGGSVDVFQLIKMKLKPAWWICPDVTPSSTLEPCPGGIRQPHRPHAVGGGVASLPSGSAPQGPKAQPRPGAKAASSYSSEALMNISTKDT